jgi:type II secretory ATPase GspE/PulE/Tfp pilus assembly ATPase PilB-like protein
MSEADPDVPVRSSDARLAFFHQLQSVADQIHASAHPEQLMLDLDSAICALFRCDRFTLYLMDRERDYIVSRVRAGDDQVRDLRLAVTPVSIAGYVALTQRTLNIADVYDAAALQRISPELRFHQGVDQRSGYRTRAMLVAPLMAPGTDELLGVVQFVNPHDGAPFSDLCQDGARALCTELAQALVRRLPDALALTTSDDTAAALACGDAAVQLDLLLAEAQRQRASVIHLEPHPSQSTSAIRLRQHGTLQPLRLALTVSHAALLTALRQRFGLPDATPALPQHARLAWRPASGPALTLRLAIVPAADAQQDAVLHLQPPATALPLTQLALQASTLERWRAMLEQPHGLLLVSGPAASGKRTMLHAMLAQLNQPQRKLWSVEETLEIRQAGLRQVTLDRAAGLDYPRALHAVLQADPDIVMLGALCDRDSIGQAVQAALNGPLLCAGTPAGSAADALVRLLDADANPLSLADALQASMALRLARRLCAHCKQPYQPGDSELALLQSEYCESLQHSAPFRVDAHGARRKIINGWRERHANERGRLTLYRACGCPQCEDGYQGMLGLQELLPASARVRQLLQQRASAAQLQLAALEEGMQTLRMDGIEKVLLGLTDMASVRAACGR